MVNFERFKEHETKRDKAELIGKTFESNKCGRFEILGLGRLGGKKQSKLYICRFIKTGFTLLVTRSQIKSKGIIDEKDFSIIRKKFKSISCNEFTVIEKTNKKYNDVAEYFYKIKFDFINGCEYEMLTFRKSIFKGSVKNPFFPSVVGVGYLGNTKAIDKRIHSVWCGMINRCTNKENKDYHQKGVFISKDWLNFTTFQKDAVNLQGWDYDKFYNKKNLVLDKDVICEKKNVNPKTYSKQTCMWLDKSENQKEMNERTNQKYFIATNTKTGVSEISNNQSSFATKYNLYQANISKCLLKPQEAKSHKGWIFKYYKEEKDE